MRIAVAGATGTVGRHLVARAESDGHEVVRLSRTDGVDVRTGDGLRPVLHAVDVGVDVTNAGTTDEHEATTFFADVARTLQRAADQAGVGHVVTLSIVGIDRVPFGYYAAKLVHEQHAAAGPVPYTLLRATQFHEFPGQLVAATPAGGTVDLPAMTVRTVAASTVAQTLLDLATSPPRGRTDDLAGPEVAALLDLARAHVAHHDLGIEIRPDTTVTAGMPPDALLPGPGAVIAGPTFADWLASQPTDG